MRIALAQTNPLVGDLDGNAKKIEAFAKRAIASGADIVVFPEMSLIGYPPRDLLERPSFVRRAEAALLALAKRIRGIAAVVGTVERNPDPDGKPLFNVAAVLDEGRVAAVRRKSLLPAYDVFDESRYFEPEPKPAPVRIRGLSLGLLVCEDIWNDARFSGRALYHADPVRRIAQKSDVLVNLSASPFVLGKERRRVALLRAIARRHHLPVLYANQVGGNDDLVFDGHSLVVDGEGRLAAHAKGFEEDLVLFDTETGQGEIHEKNIPELEQARRALVLGIRDYVTKCGFKSVLLGLSGGIDSALVAALAAEALGHCEVLGVAMPSKFSSRSSLRDARSIAMRLGIRFIVIPIEPMVRAFERSLAGAFHGLRRDTTEENLQARIRGTLLMSLSNKYGAMLLTTGNKSEVAVGYCTLYGDMCGGLAAISDLPKTFVYRLARHMNRKTRAIPEYVFTRPPSAELKPDQKDSDSLPDYGVLDGILEAYVEKSKGFSQIVRQGFEPSTVAQVVRMIERNEYKRRQMAPGLKITSRAFGVGWRMPIAHKQGLDLPPGA